jgi:hypothetical protein
VLAVNEPVSPELALVDPELTGTGRNGNGNGNGDSERKGAMSSNTPQEGMFFVDQEQPAPEQAPVQPPVAPPPPVAPAPEPSAPAAEAPPSPSSAMRDVPLGTLIFRAGLLAEEQLEDALQEGMKTGKRLGEILLERGWLHERDLGRLLAGQKGLPFLEMSAVTPDPAAVQLLPEENARLQNALPIGFEDGVPLVAVADPSNDLVVENLRRALSCEPRLVVAAHGDLLQKISQAYSSFGAAESATPPAAEPQAPEAPAPAEVPAPPAEPAPVEAQPSVQQAVTPMPTVLPPPESRPTEPQAVPVAPPAPVEQPVAVDEVPPLVVADQAPPQVPVQPPAEPAPAAQQEPAPAAPVAPSAPVAPLAAPVVQEPSPPPAPPVPSVEASPAPPPVATPQPDVPQAVEPAAAPAAPVAEHSPNGAVAEVPQAMTHFVVLRLREGEQLEIGSFGSPDEARRFAQEIVGQITAAESESTWPYFADRFLRPETIVSIDVVEEPVDRWMGSAVRTRWAAPAQ